MVIYIGLDAYKLLFFSYMEDLEPNGELTRDVVESLCRSQKNSTELRSVLVSESREVGSLQCFQS